jgi:hypothetical protein
MRRTALLDCLVAMGLVHSGVISACELMSLDFPVGGSSLVDRQPTLRWSGDPTLAYRVQVAALMPEARVMLSYDTEVKETSFRLPAALPMERAAVKVLVSRGCGSLDAQDLNAQPATFFVDVRQECAMDANALQQSTSTLSWAKKPAASGYRVRLFEVRTRGGESLVPLDGYEVAEPPWNIPAPRDTQETFRQRVVTVQAVCNGLAGRPVAMPLIR